MSSKNTDRRLGLESEFTRVDRSTCAILRLFAEIRVEIYRYLLSCKYMKCKIPYQVSTFHVFSKGSLPLSDSLLLTPIAQSRVASSKRRTTTTLSINKSCVRTARSIERPYTFSEWKTCSYASPPTNHRFGTFCGIHKAFFSPLMATRLAVSSAAPWKSTTIALNPNPPTTMKVAIAPNSTSRHAYLSATNCPTCCAL